MRLKDETDGEVLVERDPEGAFIALRIEGAAIAAASEPVAGSERVIHLTAEEARRLAALILFQAARLDRPRPWVPVVVPLRQTA